MPGTASPDAGRQTSAPDVGRTQRKQSLGREAAPAAFRPVSQALQEPRRRRERGRLHSRAGGALCRRAATPDEVELQRHGRRRVRLEQHVPGVEDLRLHPRRCPASTTGPRPDRRAGNVAAGSTPDSPCPGRSAPLRRRSPPARGRRRRRLGRSWESRAAGGAATARRPRRRTAPCRTTGKACAASAGSCPGSGSSIARWRDVDAQVILLGGCAGEPARHPGRAVAYPARLEK